MLTILALTTFTSEAQVAVTYYGSLPDNSAMLDVKSTNKGILIPRITIAERDAIANPANALLIFNTDDEIFNYYCATTASWQKIDPSASKIADNDQDTYISTEQNPDEDTIRIYNDGVEKWRFSGNTLEALNNGNSSVSSIGGQVDWSTLSDGRFKKDVKEIESGLDFILSLRPATYTVDKQAINKFAGRKSGEIPSIEKELQNQNK